MSLHLSPHHTQGQVKGQTLDLTLDLALARKRAVNHEFDSNCYTVSKWQDLQEILKTMLIIT